MNWTTYSINGNHFPGYTVVSMAPDAPGNMWFGFANEGSGVSKFDGTQWTNFDSNTPGVNFGSGISSIAMDAMGNKWFASNGLLEFDNNRWTSYNNTNSPLINNGISTLAIDVQGNKWMGAVGGVSVLYAQ
jgi:ligand-binding sensor domain-containing protein